MFSNLLIDIQPANLTGINPGKTFNLGLGPSVLAVLLYRFILCQCQQSLRQVALPSLLLQNQACHVCMIAVSLAEWGLDPPAAVLGLCPYLQVLFYFRIKIIKATCALF